MWIVDLTIADVMTLGAHTLVWIALWLILHSRIPLAISLLTVAMLVDALDGFVARKLGVARPFGRYLGGFVDLVNYTVAPPLILASLGFAGTGAYALLLVYSTAGMLRLARFNEVGNIQSQGRLAYLGLPVFWIHFVVMALYGVWALVGLRAFQIATALALPTLACCFLLNRPFWKPQNYTVIAGVTLVLAAFFAVIGLR